jgi:hypothetical protein
MDVLGMAMYLLPRGWYRAAESRSVCREVSEVEPAHRIPESGVCRVGPGSNPRGPGRLLGALGTR